MINLMETITKGVDQIKRVIKGSNNLTRIRILGNVNAMIPWERSLCL